MNSPFLWSLLRLISATIVITTIVTVGDLCITSWLQPNHYSPKPYHYVIAAAYQYASWFLVCLPALVVISASLRLCWSTPDNHKKNDKPNFAAKWASASIQWKIATNRFEHFLWGPGANKHWAFAIVLSISTLLYNLSINSVKIITQGNFHLDPNIGQIILICAIWFSSFFAYRLLTFKYPKGSSNNILWPISALLISWYSTWVLQSISPEYASIGPIITSAAIVLLAISISTQLKLKLIIISTLILTITVPISLGAYKSDSHPHKILMLKTLFGEHLMHTLLVFTDPDADNLPSSMPSADCGPMNEFQGYEAIEIIGDGIDNNCLAGDFQSSNHIINTNQLSEIKSTLETPPPIIMISVDTLRADYIGKKINGKSLTPNLDKLLKQSTHFTHAYAPSTHTKDSIPATLSGMYPGNALFNGTFLGTDRTFAEVAREIGYSTDAVTTIPDIHHLLTVGFDRIDNELGNLTRSDLSSPQVYVRAKSRLEHHAKSKKPFLLWAHFFDPHGFYMYLDNLTPWLDNMQDLILRSYAQEVWRTDAFIGKLWEEVEKQGLANKAIFIFFSDHGESLGEEGVYDHAFRATENIIRIPFAIKHPAYKGRVVSTPVSALDLFPTMMELLQVEGHDPRPGRSLLPAMKGDQLPPIPIYISANYRNEPTLWAVIEYPWKLLFDRRKLIFQLQNVTNDPNALGDVSEEHPERFEHMKLQMGKWRDLNFNNHFIKQKEIRLKERPAVIPREVFGPIYYPYEQIKHLEP